MADMPDNIKKMLEENPDILKNLANPEFVERINAAVAERPGLADWCVACGASGSQAVPMLQDVDKPLTAEEIRVLGRRLARS
jgi:hypothetical protein